MALVTFIRAFEKVDDVGLNGVGESELTSDHG
jgi:hypothetical protein